MFTLRKNNLFFISMILFSTWAGPALSAQDGVIHNLRQTGKAFAAVAKKVSPSVVLVQVEGHSQAGVHPAGPFPFGDDFLRRFFGDGIPEMPGQDNRQDNRVVGQGSGFVYKVDSGLLSKTTYIVTNNHVVENADKIRVTFKDGSEFEGKVTGADPKSDVAVIEIKDNKHPVLAMGDSTRLEVGEWVVAVGNPFGLNHTLTVGVVSAKGRTGLGINDYEDFIQTDAAINPGNSGGPLLNLDGEVVGINTAIFSKNGGGYMGIGFAIPVNLAQNIADQLIDKGKVTRGFLGIVIQDLTKDLADSFGMKDQNGILVAQVGDDSPAAKAGIKVGDIILEYEGKKVSKVADFRNRVAQTKPGSKQTLVVIRNGKQLTLKVKIGNMDDNRVQTASSAETADELGMTVQTITPDMADQFNVEPGKGVVVVGIKPGSVASMAGLRPGAVILQVNRKPVNSIEDFRKEIKRYKDKKRILLLISDRGVPRYLSLSW